MKEALSSAVHHISTDRVLLVSLVLLGVVSVIFTLATGLQIHPSELQVNTHYTSFGSENFYRTPWHYLLGFVFFGLMVGVVHSAITFKLYIAKHRSMALIFCWLSIFLLIVSYALVHRVIGIAALS